MVKHLTPLGKMTLFYIPSHKLDAPGPVGQHTPRGQIHEFLMQHYRAYTHTPSPVKGFWLNEDRAVLHDVLERFEVSFESEEGFEPNLFRSQPRGLCQKPLPRWQLRDEVQGTRASHTGEAR